MASFLHSFAVGRTFGFPPHEFFKHTLCYLCRNVYIAEVQNKWVYPWFACHHEAITVALRLRNIILLWTMNIYVRRHNEHDKIKMCVRARRRLLALVTQMCPSPSCQQQLHCSFRQKNRWMLTDWHSRERFNQKHLAYRVWGTNHRHHNWIPLCNHFSC